MLALRRSSLRTRKGNAVRALRPQAAAVPATVGGERPALRHWLDTIRAGKAAEAQRPASQETCRRSRSSAGRDLPREPDSSVAATRAAPRRFGAPLSLTTRPMGAGRVGERNAPMRHLFGAALVSACIAAPAWAEEGEEIVVTVTRAPAAARMLPATVDVIDLKTTPDGFTLDRALEEVIGLQIPRTGPVGQQASIFSGGFESNHTLVLFDGVRLDDPATPESVFDAGQTTLGDAERVEVVQGPMSALYGSSAVGAVINVLPRRGGEAPFNPRFAASFGSFGTMTTTLGVDGAVGVLRYAATAESYVSEGFDIVPARIATYTGERDGGEIASFTAVFDIALNERLAADLLFRRRRARVDFDPGLFGNIAESPHAIIQSDSALWRLGAKWTGETFTARVTGGGLETDRRQSEARHPGDSYVGARRFVDATLQTGWAGWTVVLGAQGEQERIDAVSFGSPVVGEQEHGGVFAVAQRVFGPLSLSAAARRDSYEEFGAQTTWRAGAVWMPHERLRLYAAYGTAFRAPSLYERFVPFFGAAGLEPEHAQSAEAGGDATLPFWGRRDGFELRALYRTSQIEDLIGFFGFSYANVDRAEIDFAEARATLRPARWLSLGIVYANTDARDGATGTPLQRRPRHAWSAELLVRNGPFEAGLTWRETGARLDTVYDDLGLFAGVDRVAAYDLTRATASWRIGQTLQLFVAGDNLFDEVYEPVNGFAGAPRSVMAGIRVAP